MAHALVHSLYGEPATRGSRPVDMAEGSRPAPPGGAEYVGRGKCKASNDTCEAFPVKGGDYCIGHQRALDKVLAERGAE